MTKKFYENMEKITARARKSIAHSNAAAAHLQKTFQILSGGKWAFYPRVPLRFYKINQ